MQTMRWFGRDHKAPVNELIPRIDTPVGATCVLCEAPIQADDDGFIDAGGSVHHRRCLLDALGIEGLGEMATRNFGDD